MCARFQYVFGTQGRREKEIGQILMFRRRQETGTASAHSISASLSIPLILSSKMATKESIPITMDQQNPVLPRCADIVEETSSKEYRKESDDVVVTVISEEFDQGETNMDNADIYATSGNPPRKSRKRSDPINEKYFGFSDKSVRRGFIKKVYGVLFLQLSLTLSIGSVIFYNESISEVLTGNFTFFWAMVAIIFASLIILFCVRGLRRTPPFNYIFLGLFTAAEAGLVGGAATAFESREVLMAVGVVTVLTLCLTLFAFQSKYDFTLLFCLMGAIMFVLCVFGAFLVIFPSRRAHFFYCGLIVLVFSIHMVLDTQLMMGGKHFFRITPEEYVVAALNLYMDILNLFLHILVLIRS